MSLPFSPDPFQDELLSSWIERVGIFYGIQYENTLALLSTPMQFLPDRHVDSNVAMRERIAQWTGRELNSVPATFTEDDAGLLDETARLTYCARCWDDDVASGRPPYIRRIWSDWATVSCRKHQTWLTSRCPQLYVRSFINGWESTWQSNSQWATAGNLKYDPHTAVLANAFIPDTIADPDRSWDSFENAIGMIKQEMEIGRITTMGCVLKDVIQPEFFDLRAKTLLSLQIRPPVTRLGDIDLKGYRRTEPGWIAQRIACLVVAVELFGMVLGTNPIFKKSRAFVEKSDCARTWISLKR